MINVSSWSIRNPIPSILFFVLLTICGLFGFRSMKIQNMPDIDMPMVVVTASLPGAAPAQLETEVARKIENSVSTIEGVKHIYTNIQNGIAIMTVEFNLEKSTQEGYDDVRDAVQRIRSSLPGELNDPVITKSNIASRPILAYTVASSRMDDEALSWFVDNEVTKTVLSVTGVGAVSRVGGVSRQVRVDIDPDRLMALGVTVSDISRQLHQIQRDASGGRTDIGGLEQSVRLIATVKTAEELAKMEIPLPNGNRVRLDQVAQVEDAVAEQRSAAFLDGKRVVGFEVVRSKGAGVIDVMHDVREELAKLKKEHPDIEVHEAFNFVTPIANNYKGSMYLLFEGAALAVLVVWLFLRDFRSTLVSATALPLSIIPTFGAMYFLGFTINGVTLISISLVVGILVDDAIVEIENIIRHLKMGKTPYQAAMEAADEIGLAVIATTFSLVAVFLPTAFMTGIVGKFFVQFGWTAAIAVFFSLVVARMLTPMMAAYMLRSNSEKQEPARWELVYMKMAVWCLANRFKTSLIVAFFFFGTLFGLTPLLPKGFMPADDLPQTQVVITLPPGSSFNQTLESIKQAEGIVSRNPHVKTIYTTLGGGAAGSDPFVPQGGGNVCKGTLTINLTERSERRGISKQDIEAEFRRDLDVIAGARIVIGLGGRSEKYQLSLSGEDGRVLSEHARRVRQDLRSIPGVGSVTSSTGLVQPELEIRPDFERAAALGVTTTAIADTLRVATSGDYDQALSKLNLSQRQVPIVVKLQDEARKDPSIISRLTVPGRYGPVPLSNVAEIKLVGGQSKISRYDRSRNVVIDVELNGIPLGEVEQKAEQLPSLQKMPPGVSRVAFGDAEAMIELFQGFSMAMVTGVLCIYVVLVLLFKDFVQPITILAALVLSVPGAIFALFLSHTALSMPAMIGMIMLMGVATKNSILLVEYAVMARKDRGMNRWDALLDACSKRARPIVMTTVAMGAGMLPIAIGLGTDPSFRAPMAIVVIGGLVTSTFLSLLVIPVVFTYIDDARAWVLRLAGR